MPRGVNGVGESKPAPRARAGIHDLDSLLMLELLPVDVLHHAPLGDEVHTLFHPILADRAARAFFTGRSGGLPYTATGAAVAQSAKSSLWRAYASAGPDGLSGEQLRRAADQIRLL